MERFKVLKFDTVDDAIEVFETRQKLSVAIVNNQEGLVVPEIVKFDDLLDSVNFYPDTFEFEYLGERFENIRELAKRAFEDSEDTTMCDCCDEYHYSYDLETFNIASDNGNYNTKVCEECHADYVKHLSAEEIKDIVESDIREALDDYNDYEQHFRIGDGEVLKISQYILNNLDVEYLRANNQINAGAHFFKEEVMEVLEADPNIAILSVMHEC